MDCILWHDLYQIFLTDAFYALCMSASGFQSYQAVILS